MNPDVHTVTVFNAGTTPPTKLAEIPVGYDPESVAINPSSPKAYVANAFSGTISVIDLNALFVTNTIAVGAEPMGVAVSPNGTRLYVANSASNSVSVINTSTETVIATIDVSAFGTAPRALAITNNGDGNDNDETILVALFFAQLRAGKTSAEGGGRTISAKGASSRSPPTPTPSSARHSSGRWRKTANGGLGVGFNSNGQLAPAVGTTPVVASTNPQSFTTPTGAFPNQLASIALQPNNGRAFVVSTGASPNGPLRFNPMAQGLVSVFGSRALTAV